MPTIFISYRRADSLESTGRVYDRLAEAFGAECVFRDIDSIPLGIPFPELLRQTLSRANVVLVIIGPSWLSVTNPHGQRRLFELADLVRMEVECALQQDLPVIPVMVGNAPLPKEECLPESIRGLAQRNGFAVRPDPDFHRDMDRLCLKVQELLGFPDAPLRKAELLEQLLAKHQAELERINGSEQFRWHMTQEKLRKLTPAQEQERAASSFRDHIFAIIGISLFACVALFGRGC